VSAFSIELSEDAASIIDSMPGPIRTRIIRELARLARNPAAESKQPTSTHPRGRLFEIEMSFDYIDVYIDVIFKYAPDEATLIITHVFVETL
jgi:hypothetical protein